MRPTIVICFGCGETFARVSALGLASRRAVIAQADVDRLAGDAFGLSELATSVCPCARDHERQSAASPARI